MTKFVNLFLYFQTIRIIFTINGIGSVIKSKHIKTLTEFSPLPDAYRPFLRFVLYYDGMPGLHVKKLRGIDLK